VCDRLACRPPPTYPKTVQISHRRVEIRPDQPYDPLVTKYTLMHTAEAECVGGKEYVVWKRVRGCMFGENWRGESIEPRRRQGRQAEIKGV
jgi:hypothetical protein